MTRDENDKLRARIAESECRSMFVLSLDSVFRDTSSFMLHFDSHGSENE